MLRYLAFGAVAAGILCGTAVLAQNAKVEPLWVSLADNDIDAKIIPEGYTLVVTQPIARGAFEHVQKVEGVAQARFTRASLVKTSPALKNVHEGFNYYVFRDPQSAARFSMPVTEWAYSFRTWFNSDAAHHQFDKAKPYAEFSTAISSTSGTTIELQCIEWDVFVGCQRPEPGLPVAIHLIVVEPELRSAANETGRRRVAEARVQSEAEGLLRTAQLHLAASLKVANP
ncbi:MAG: hypothetical protein K2Z25_25660 [Beijerinckiaceae bacterium]|nr:hypothetical protein [Beijerinckiaceae bacterium]